MQPAQFFAAIKPGAIASWSKGVLPSVTAAQAAIESAWGSSALAQPPNNNLFGIKGSYNGQFVWFPTREYYGYWTTINAAFRKYPNWSASVLDHASFFVDNSRYHNLLYVRDYATFATLVQRDGYATAPNYASSIIATIQANGLAAWDQEAFKTGGKAAGGEPQVDFNSFNTGRDLSGSIGLVWVTNIHGAPVYSEPYPGHKSNQRKSLGSAWKVSQVIGNYYRIGKEQWLAVSDVAARIYNNKWIGATIELQQAVYPTATPTSGKGLGTKPLPKGNRYLVTDYQDGHVNLGNPAWIPLQVVKIV